MKIYTLYKKEKPDAIGHFSFLIYFAIYWIENIHTVYR